MKSKTIFVLVALWATAISGACQLVKTDQLTLTVTPGAVVTVNGSVEAGNATFITNNGTISVTGDIINDSGNDLFGTSAGLVVLNGFSQVIGGSDPIQFNDLDLVNGGDVLLQNDASTGGGYAFPAGNFQIGNKRFILNSNTLTVNNPLPSAVSRVSGFVVSETDDIAGYGIVKWLVGNPSAGNYIWPFGNDVSGDYLPVTIQFNAAGMGTGSFSISTYPTDPFQTPNNRPLPAGLTSFTDFSGNENAHNVVDRFWVIHTEDFLVDPVGDLSLTYRDTEANTGTNTFNENLLQSQFQDGVVWSQPPSGVVDATNNFVFTPAVSTWNYNWVLVASNAYLPISLVEFDAKPLNNEEVLCTWVTESEINNDFFIVERSLDALAFEEIGQVDGAGTSSGQLLYDFTDPNPYTGWSYYRLRQMDFSGISTWSDVKAVFIGAEDEWNVSVYPNPFHEMVTLNISGAEGTEICEIFDAQGRSIILGQIAPVSSAEKMSINIDLSNLEAGNYSLVVSGSRHRSVKRLVKL